MWTQNRRGKYAISGANILGLLECKLKLEARSLTSEPGTLGADRRRVLGASIPPRPSSSLVSAENGGGWTWPAVQTPNL